MIVLYSLLGLIGVMTLAQYTCYTIYLIKQSFAEAEDPQYAHYF